MFQYTQKILMLMGASFLMALLVSCGGSSVKNDGSVLRIANSAELSSLDPNTADGVWESRVFHDIFEGLVTYDAEANTVPGLAKSWDVSPDGKTYTFHLRETSWSDGVPVTAGDFVTGFHRLVDPSVASSYASYFNGVIKGASEAVKGKDPSLLQLEAKDDKTLVIHLAIAAPYFLSMLTHCAVSPAPTHLIKKLGKAWLKPGNIVSNGPYKIKEYQMNDHLTLVKNNQYYGSTGVSIDKIIYYPIQVDSSRISRFRSGGVDIAWDMPLNRVDSLKKDLGDEAISHSLMGSYFYIFNFKKKNKLTHDVRRAMSLALDRAAIIKNIVPSSLPAYGYIPPGIENYKGRKIPLDFVKKPMEERIKEAQELMKKAGYGPENRLEVSLSYNSNEVHKKIAVSFLGSMKKIYVDVVPLNSDANTHYAKIHQGDFEIARSGWIADYNDPQSFFILLSDLKDTYGSHDIQKVVDLIKKANLIADLDKRAKLLEKAEEIAINEESIFLPIYFYSSTILLSSKLEGFSPNSMDAHFSRYMRFKKQ